jgi:hypothetical protein
VLTWLRLASAALRSSGAWLSAARSTTTRLGRSMAEAGEPRARARVPPPPCCGGGGGEGRGGVGVGDENGESGWPAAASRSSGEARRVRVCRREVGKRKADAIKAGLNID